MTTPVNGLQELRQSQSKPHVPINAAIRTLDAITCLSVLQRIATPAGGEATGTRYIVTTGTGDFAGYDDHVAVKTDTGWEFYEPKDGWFARVRDEAVFYFYNVDASVPTWEEFQAGGGPPLTDVILSEMATPSSPSANTARLYNRDQGPLGLPHWLLDNGLTLSLLRGVGATTYRQFRESGITNDGVLQEIGCDTAQVFGSIFDEQPTYADLLHSFFHLRYETTAGVSNSTASARASVEACGVLRGNVSNKYGGFLAHFRIGSTACSATNTKFFAGLRSGFTNLDTTDPPDLLDCIGIAKGFSDTNLQLIHNDGSGTATKVDLGFTLASLSGKLLDLYLVGTREGNVRYALFNDTTLVASGERSTDLPTASVRLYPIVHINNANVTTVQDVHVIAVTWFDFSTAF